MIGDGHEKWMLQRRVREREARALEGVGDAEEKGFVGDGADELEADGEAVGREAAGKGDGGEAAEIGGAIVAEKKRAGGMVGTGDGGGFFTDERRGDGSGGNDESVDFGLGHGGVEALDEGFANFQGLKIGGGENLGAEFEAGADVFAVVGGMGRKPAGVLVVVGGLGPGDLVAGVLGFVQQRNGDFAESRAEFAKDTQGLLECRLNFHRKNLQEKILRHTQAKRKTVGRFYGVVETRLLIAANEDRVKEQGGVGSGTRERADAIEAGREGNDTVNGDAAESGFEADDTAEGCGDAEGAAGIGANAAITEAGGKGGSRASAGATRNAGKIPGIASGTEVGIVGGDAIGEFVKVGFAE